MTEMSLVLNNFIKKIYLLRNQVNARSRDFVGVACGSADGCGRAWADWHYVESVSQSLGRAGGRALDFSNITRLCGAGGEVAQR